MMYDGKNDVSITLGNLIIQVQFLENDLNNIISQEIVGLVVRSRIKWVEHGEKSSR